MRPVRIAAALAAVTALSCAAFVTSAGAGTMELAAPLTISKVVSGPVPAGTTFTVLVSCDGDIIDDGMGVPEAGGLSAQGKGPGGLSSIEVTFDEFGNPTSENPIGFVGPGSCTVTETGAGGAATISYQCTGQIPQGGEVVPKDGVFGQGGGMITDPCASITAAGVTVLIEEPDQFAVVTVTNTFDGTPAAQPVVVTPAFTG
jgi:hypothetical protein